MTKRLGATLLVVGAVLGGCAVPSEEGEREDAVSADLDTEEGAVDEAVMAPGGDRIPCDGFENSPTYWCGVTGRGCTDVYYNFLTGNMSATNAFTGERYVWNYVGGHCYLSIGAPVASVSLE